MSEVKCSTCKGIGRLEFEQGQRRVPCVTCSGSGIDWRKTCEGVQQEAEVLRYDLQVAHSVINAHKPDFDAQRLRADTAEAELVKLLDKLSYEERDHHTTNLIRDAWRNKYEELLSLLNRAQNFVAFVHKCCRKNKEYAPLHWQEMVELDRDLSAAALNPNPESSGEVWLDMVELPEHKIGAEYRMILDDVPQRCVEVEMSGRKRWFYGEENGAFPEDEIQAWLPINPNPEAESHAIP